MEIAKDGWTLRLVRRPGSGLTQLTQPPMAPASNAPSAPKVVREREADALIVKAPLAGTVYLSSSPAEPPFVEVGSSRQHTTRFTSLAEYIPYRIMDVGEM